MQEVPLPGRFNLGDSQITPHELVVLEAQATSSLTLTTTPTLVPGATVTLRHPGLWVVRGVFDFLGNGDTGQTGVGYLYVAGVAEARKALLRELTTEHRATVGQTWVVNKVARGPTVLELRADKTGGAGSSLAYNLHTSIVALTLPRV